MFKKSFKKVFLTSLFFCVIANFCYAGTWENFIRHDIDVGSIGSTKWEAQLVKIPASHTIYGVKFWLHATSSVYDPNETFYVRLASTTNGLPDITKVIATSTPYYQQIIIPTLGSEYQFIFDKEVDVSEGTYAIILNIPSDKFYTKGTSTNSEGYGYHAYSNDSGRTWATSSYSNYFKTMGETIATTSMCECTTTLTYISNASTGAGFWLNSSISLGDFLICTFLMIIAGVILVQFIFNLEIPKKINFKKT